MLVNLTGRVFSIITKSIFLQWWTLKPFRVALIFTKMVSLEEVNVNQKGKTMDNQKRYLKYNFSLSKNISEAKITVLLKKSQLDSLTHFSMVEKITNTYKKVINLHTEKKASRFD